MKRPLILAFSLFLTSTPVLAASASSSASVKPATYQDVPAGSWFEESVLALRHDGFLDASKQKYFPAAPAQRAEFLKLVMLIAGIKPGTPPMLPSFDDVKKDAWYYGIIEESAKEGWVRGDRECYGSTPLAAGGSRPCRVHPESPITRAQAAALLARIFGWERKTLERPYIDVSDTDWFAYVVYAAAERCILNGNKETLRIRPDDGLTRGEMAVMLHRAQLVQAGANICGSI